MNQSQAARAFGVSQSTISYRVQHHGVTPVEAAQFEKGLRPTSLAAQARAHNITPNTVRASMRNKGWSLELALTYPLMRKNSIAKKAREAGLPPRLVVDRLRQGWSLEQALSTPPLGRGGRNDRAKKYRGRI